MPPFSASLGGLHPEAAPERGPLRFLVVDDDPYYAGYLGLLIRAGFGAHSELDIAASVEEALLRLNAADYDVCFLDYSLPPHTGMDVLRGMAGRRPDTVFIFATSNERREDIAEALREGASNYLIKARISPYDLFKVVSEARLQKRRDTSPQLALEG